MNLPRLKFLRTAARVERLHTLKGRHTQSVGEHTFNVYWLAETVVHPRVMSSELVHAIMSHDVTECVTGDMPGPTKRDPAIEKAMTTLESALLEKFEILEPKLTEWEQAVLTYCDKMEFMLHAMEEVECGNAMFLPRIRRGLNSMPIEVLNCTPIASEIWNWLFSRTMSYPEHYGEDTIYGWPE